jgi:hypothetical protein
VSIPYNVHFRSPLMRRPDAATWHIARDVSQRAEPDVRPLGRAVSAFIVEKTRRLTIPLTGDVPPQHLMRPIHSVGRRRPGHPAGGVHVQSIITRTLTGRLPCMPKLHRSRISGREEIALATSISCSKYYIHYVPGLACRGSAPLYVPPFSYKRGGTQRYKKVPMDTQALLDTLGRSQVHTSSRAQYITQWSRVLCSGGPNHSKSLCVLMFFPFSN